MQWDRLLSDFRMGRAEQYKRDKHRPPWQFDSDRITFSSAFRRLKDKAQVFPLSSSDYIRTRLTHSVEVSAVGRTLGTRIGYFLAENGHISGEIASPEEIGAIVAAANLAHDIGNPPFGHSGEAAIQKWCLSSKLGTSLLKSMRELERADLERYDGNAQGFRLLTCLQLYRRRGGMQLTAATLGAYSKYPVQSWPSADAPSHVGQSSKKSGFFQAEKECFKTLAAQLGLLSRNGKEYWWVRHPLAFVTEAADDICYRIVDLEDAYNQKLISWNAIEGILEMLLRGEQIDRIKKENESERIEVVRALAIGEAITHTVEAFQRHYSSIMQGTFDRDLIGETTLRDAFEEIKTLQRKFVYNNDKVLKIEVAGFSVIGGLLDHFVEAANDIVESGSSKRAQPLSEKIIGLVPSQFFANGTEPSQDPYTRLLEIVDFVSGMTDSYALNLFRSLTGIQLP